MNQRTQYELRRMADADTIRAAGLGVRVEPEPLEVDWRQRYVDSQAANGVLEAALDRHARRWRNALIFMGVQMAVIVALLVVVGWRWM